MTTTAYTPAKNLTNKKSKGTDLFLVEKIKPSLFIHLHFYT